MPSQPPRQDPVPGLCAGSLRLGPMPRYPSAQTSKDEKVHNAREEEGDARLESSLQRRVAKPQYHDAHKVHLRLGAHVVLFSGGRGALEP